MLKETVLKFAAASLILFGTTSLQAQEAAPEKTTCEKKCTKGKGMKKHKREDNKQAFIETLSESQKNTFASLKKQREDSRSAMKASFSPEQLAIVNNKALDRKAQKEALRATFTAEQKEQRQASKLAGKNAKDSFVATLSEEQKALMPKRRHGKGKKACEKGQKERRG